MKKGATDVVLSAYNFTMDKAASEAMSQANAAGLGVVAMKVMAGGFRRSKPDDPNAAKLKREGAMLAALKWVLKDSYIHTTIPGMTDMDQLDENLKAMTESYSPKEEQLLARQLEFHYPALLPYVRRLRRPLRQRPASGGCASLRNVRRRLRPIRTGPRPL